MYLKKLLRRRHTVAFRLTLWYAGIFTVSSLVAFLGFYIMIISGIHRRTDQALVGKMKEFSSLFASQGVEAVRAEMVREAKSTGTEKVFFRIVTPYGEELATSDLSAWKNIGVARGVLKHVTNGTPLFETVIIPGHRHKVRVLYAAIGPSKVLEIGQSLRDDERLMEDFREIFGTVMAVVLVLAALVGWFMARRALSGVEEVTRTAINIANGSLVSRVPVKGGGNEIDQLATTFNGMLDRIQALVTGMREITDNIAHDLRSPITRIRGIAEMTLTSRQSIDEYETMAGSIVEECDRLLGMINTMLDISEADAGVAKMTMVEVDVAKMIQDAYELFQPVGEDKNVTINMETPIVSFVCGDIQKLQRVLANLLDNAVKYTPTGGTINVLVTENKAQVMISVKDTGIGISKKDLPHVFERFYRGDQSRSQAGIGLGLSLARAIVRAHGGDLTVTSFPGKGSTFTVILPRVLPCS